MIAIRKILCPIDLSPCADRALAYAAELAEKLSAELTILYAVPDVLPMMPDATMPMPISGSDADELLASGRAALAERLAASTVSRANPKTEVRLGSAEAEIVAVAKELPADLIVIGTHGRRGLAHFFLGSVAEKIVRTAPCPVLTVRG